MRKILLILTVVLVVACFASCGNSNNDTTTQPPETTEATTVEAQEDVVIKISKKNLTDAESFKKEMESFGAKSEDLSDEEAFEFTFSKADHDKLLKAKFDETVNEFKKYEEDSEHYIDKIEYDEDFRNMTFNVNKSLYEASGNTTTNYVVAARALSYQLYLEDGQKTNVKVVYSDTEEVVSTFTLPMTFSVE